MLYILNDKYFKSRVLYGEELSLLVSRKLTHKLSLALYTVSSLKFNSYIKVVIYRKKWGRIHTKLLLKKKLFLTLVEDGRVEFIQWDHNRGFCSGEERLGPTPNTLRKSGDLYLRNRVGAFNR